MSREIKLRLISADITESSASTLWALPDWIVEEMAEFNREAFPPKDPPFSGRVFPLWCWSFS